MGTAFEVYSKDVWGSDAWGSSRAFYRNQYCRAHSALRLFPTLSGMFETNVLGFREVSGARSDDLRGADQQETDVLHTIL